MGHKLICTNCREARNLNSDFSKIESMNKICLNCSSEVVLISHRFRPPRKNDFKKWEVIKFLVENNFKFEHIQDNIHDSYIKIPETIYEAKEFIELYKKGNFN